MSSVLLAAILLKMAGYGFIRFSVGLFPVAQNILFHNLYIKFNCNYLLIISCSMQEDMKKLIAYSSVAIWDLSQWEYLQ